MKKILAIFLIGIIGLSACTQVEPVDLRVLTPAGAPATALIPLMKEGSRDDVKVVDGTDVLSAELVNGSYDVIVAPVNLGLTLASKGNSDYILYGILTWGNLYLVGNEKGNVATAGDVALFGQAAVPQKIWDTVKITLGNVRNEVYLNAVADVQVGLLTSKYDLGLMAEPAVTATILKAKSNGLTLTVVEDLQEAWKAETGLDNYPQAGLFIRKDADANVKAAVKDRFATLKEYVAAIDADPQTIIADVNAVGAKNLGIASGEVIAAAWAKMNVKVVNAKEVQEEIQAFMDLFNLNDIEDFIQK